MDTAFIRPDVKAFVDFLNSATAPKLHQIPIEQGREMMRSQRALTDAEPIPLAVVRDVLIPGPAGAIPARLYDPRESRDPGPAIVYFHGGGFVVGDLDSHDPICREIAQEMDLPLIAVDYRLAPENPWPAAPADCEAAARWIAGSPDALGRSITGLVLAGDSAGGTLSAVTAIALRDQQAAVPLLAQWLIYPAIDLENSASYTSYQHFSEGFLLSHDAMTWFNDCYQADMSHWRASPLRADLAGLPPTLIVTAGLDPLRDQGRTYAAALTEAGVETIYLEAPGIIHGFVNLRKALPSSASDIRKCLNLLKCVIAETGNSRP